MTLSSLITESGCSNAWEFSDWLKLHHKGKEFSSEAIFEAFARVSDAYQERPYSPSSLQKKHVKIKKEGKEKPKEEPKFQKTEKPDFSAMNTSEYISWFLKQNFSSESDALKAEKSEIEEPKSQKTEKPDFSAMDTSQWIAWVLKDKPKEEPKTENYSETRKSEIFEPITEKLRRDAAKLQGDLFPKTKPANKKQAHEIFKSISGDYYRVYSSFWTSFLIKELGLEYDFSIPSVEDVRRARKKLEENIRAEEVAGGDCDKIWYPIQLSFFDKFTKLAGWNR